MNCGHTQPYVMKFMVHGEERGSVFLNSSCSVSVMMSLPDDPQPLTKPIPKGALLCRPHSQPGTSIWKLCTCKSSVAPVMAGVFGSGWSC